MIERIAEATEPTPEACERLTAAFSNRSTRDRLALLPAPHVDVARLLTPRRARAPWLLLPIALGTALALAVGLRQSPPVRAQLDAPAEVALALTPEVALVYAGVGVVDGTRDAPRIQWEVGELNVSVEPGIKLAVTTDEGTAQVHGTRFRVVRDVFGTTVSVSEGEVAVSCGAVLLGPGEFRTCPPLRPAGLLARARALSVRSDALASVRDGLAIVGSDDPVRGELLALQAQLYVEDGNPEAARTAARLYLVGGYSARTPAMRHLLESTP
jgi:ferric-dicitrate binding protein FerR (iron transport regulator)